MNFRLINGLFTILLCVLLIRLLVIDMNGLVAVDSKKTENPYYIHVDLDLTTMYVFKDGEVHKTYPVCGGKYSTPSPLGTWTIISKANWGEGFGGSWMGFNVPWGKYGIHGTDEPWTVGSNASKGCIRMYNDDAKELRSYIPHGTKVSIAMGEGYFGYGYKTLKPGARGSDVFAVQLQLKELGYYHGHPDGIYGDGLKAAVTKFKKSNNLGSNPWITSAVYEAMGFFPFE
ncbi:L,D-transpeptidase family protein [Vallitalea okinawensis]|uniref:L,D-transpeptidase family protein n=1 Tax=Vallitalea okinawensis TaxID=2078660 RepID=UPI000CFAECBA|nr:L,D-transpeptidase family protein [Vallitalea okinawensis]